MVKVNSKLLHSEDTPNFDKQIRQTDTEKLADDTQTGVFPQIKTNAGIRRTTTQTISTWSEFIREIRHSRHTRSIVAFVILLFLGAALGFGFVAQQRITDTSYTSLSESELVSLLDETNNQVSRLESQKTQLDSQLASIQSAANKQQEIERVAKLNQDANDILSGKVAATGPGVEITITQGSQKVTAAALFTVIEELRNAGAEVIQIGDVRVVTSTYVINTSSGLMSDGKYLTSPYVIKAIGDKSNLQDAIEISGGVGSTLRVNYDAVVKVAQKDKVTISALANTFEYKYAKTVE
ncbi:DUF881 domain-containing protein [Alloscardovia venturai]|uniref:DUF881 domain-containing protein n=1 Tax=Alloscardovia venturai TaxID=1769421 RepID=A0ABW2Y5C9_9BIFI